MPEPLFLFYSLLVVVAFLYSSVGHGGASGYLALMAIFSMSPGMMRPTALLLNLFVSAVSFSQFYRGGYFKWKIFWPFAIASIPLSFVGGMITIESDIYKKILGVFLVFAVFRFLFFKNVDPKNLKEPNMALSLIVGGAIGFFSGLIGIGGGIILSPVLLLLKWTDQKKTAAISALFIFVNSAAGFAGQLTQGIEFSPDMVYLVAVAFVGGLCGSYFGALRFPQTTLKYVLAFVLALAAYKLLFTYA